MDIKDYREKGLRQYVIVCGLLGFFLIFHEDALANNYDLVFKVISNGTLMSCVSCAVYLMDFIYSRKGKDVLTLFVITGRPGEKIFSETISTKKDMRINVDEAKSRYSEIYDKMPKAEKERREYENAAWYKISRNLKDDAMVMSSHRDYLLCRDMCVATVSMLIILICLYVFRLLTKDWKMIIILIILYGITLIITHNKANNYCLNVIVADLTSNQEKKDLDDIKSGSERGNENEFN